jgi:anti-sigma regulatory factor (Ser/Thr protein kinase)
MSSDGLSRPAARASITIPALSRLSRELAAEPEPAAALWRLVEAIRADLEIDRIGVYAYDRTSNTLSHVTGVSALGQPEFSISTYELDEEVTPLKRVARREIPYYFTTDVQRDYPHVRLNPAVRSHVILPIIAGDELVGALCADNCLTGREMPETLLEPLFLYAGLAALPLFALYQRKERERVEELRHHIAAEVLFAVTSGRVLLCGPEEIRSEWPAPGQGVTIGREEDIRRVREAVHRRGLTVGMQEQRAADLVLCASEAATNALLHGGGGGAVVEARDGRVRVRVTDHGHGISAEDLPRATLLKGWSTRASMGLGFTIINETADRVFLHTGPEGTTLIVEMAVEPETCLPGEADPLFWGQPLALAELE